MKKFAIVVALLLLVTPAAWSGAFVGASLGQSDTTAGGVSNDETGWKVMGGYNFMKYAGVEGSYRSLGSYDETFGSTNVDLDASSIDVFGVGILPVGKSFELFAKAGYSRIEMDATVTDPSFGTISGSDSENELVYGAGFSFKIGEKFAVRLEYEAFDTAEDMDMMSAGAVFKF